MHYIIYLDVLFVVNFIMDYVVLTITTGILIHTTTLKRAVSKKQLFLLYIKRIVGSLVGALWACVLVRYELNAVIWNGFTYVIIGPGMIIIIFGKERIKNYLKGVGILYAVAFLLGGGMHFVYYYTSIGYILNDYGSMKSWMLIPGCALGGLLLEWLIAFLCKKGIDSKSRYTVVLELKETSVTLKALCDTGNNLYDPIYGECVSVVLSKAVTNLIKENTSYHLIPYSSIGNENGLIPVVRINRLKIIGEKETLVVEQPLLALYSGNFSGNTDYELIIHPDMLKKTKG